MAKTEKMRPAAVPQTPQPKLRGVNLAGWLVLESWITPSIFASTGTFDEEGLEGALDGGRLAEVLDRHRREFITMVDFEGIATRGYNAVRLPVPWHLFGAEGPQPSAIPECASYVAQALDWAAEFGIRAIIDLASVPGMTSASNGHSIVVDADGGWRGPALAVVAEIARRFGSHEALLAIEPLEEPLAQGRVGLRTTEGVPLHVLRNYYRDCYEAIRGACGERVALLCSCAGRPGAWARFMVSPSYRNVWLDVHCYQFDEAALRTGPGGVAALSRRSEDLLRQAERSELPVVVGEWSAALPATAATVTPEGRIAMERVYASAQMRAFSSARGWFFQTWKTATRLSSWDARIALATFERGMIG